MRQNLLNWATLLTSSSTLVCCALPALLVTLGMGATLGSLVTVFPQLQWLSLHKVELFSFSAVMLIIAGYFQYRARFASCPIDPVLARTCMRTRHISAIIYSISVVIFLIGYFFAFWAARLFF